MAVEKAQIVELLKRNHLFRGVDEQRIQSAANLMIPVSVRAGTSLYRAGDVPDFFYFIVEGRVQMLQPRERGAPKHSLGFLVEGDYFGQELLESNWRRQLSALAETDTVLLKIPEANFIAILEMIPVLGKRLQFILDSYRLMLTTSFKWLNPDEIIYFIARRHALFLWVNILPPVFTGIITFAILLYFFLSSSLNTTLLTLMFFSGLGFFFWFVWQFVDWANDYFIVTSHRIVYQERVVLLYDSRQESPNEAIQSSAITTTQVGRILGYGRVSVRTYIGTILFRDVSNPEQVVAIVNEQQLRSQVSSRKAELKAIESVIQRKINQQPAPPGPPKPAAPKQARPNAFQRYLTDLLHLRYESGGTILYRTHWFILLGKVIIPTVLLFGLMAVTGYLVIYQPYPVPLLGTCGLAGLVWFAILLWWLYEYLDWHEDVYLITPDQIIDVNKKPLGHESRQTAQIKNILSIEYKRLGLLGLILNYGTVFIRVGDQQLTFDDVYNPSEVQRELFHRLAAKNYSERQAAAENERQRIAEWIGAYHRVAQQNRVSSGPAGNRDS